MADITNWHGKPIGDLSRGELIDALDWCVKQLREHNSDYHHQSKDPMRNAGGWAPSPSLKDTGPR